MDVELLRSSFELVLEREPNLANRFFYDMLFVRYPQTQLLFRRYSRENQNKMFIESLIAIIEHLEDVPWLDNILITLGKRHIDYGVTPEMYDWVGECLLEIIKDVAADVWTEGQDIKRLGQPLMGPSLG